MTHEKIMDLEGDAWSAVLSGDFDVAAEKYTAAAYTSLGTSTSDNLTKMSPGLVLLLRASLCYRIAEHDEKAVFRARAGLLFVEEIRDCLVTEDVERGLTFEYGGDFRVVGGLDGHSEAYRRAEEYYEPYEDSTGMSERIGMLSEPPFHENTELLREITASAGECVDDEEAADIEFRSPVRRIRFKRAHLGDMVAELVERGEWTT